MGILNFSKKKISGALSGNDQNKTECDYSKTEEIIKLLKIPKENRDETWNRTFLEIIRTARFSESIPQLIIGPDEFPYFVLKTSEPYNPFESFCLVNMTEDFLLDNGFGVVLNPREDDADWVFSWGDILHLHLYKDLVSISEHSLFPDTEISEMTPDILISQPDENYLPAFAKDKLRFFLKKNEIKQPKILMICREIDGVNMKELVFNLFRENFSSPEKFYICLNRLRWFLPKHYRIATIPENSEIAKKLARL